MNKNEFHVSLKYVPKSIMIALWSFRYHHRVSKRMHMAGEPMLQILYSLFNGNMNLLIYLLPFLYPYFTRSMHIINRVINHCNYCAYYKLIESEEFIKIVNPVTKEETYELMTNKTWEFRYVHKDNIKKSWKDTYQFELGYFMQYIVQISEADDVPVKEVKNLFMFYKRLERKLAKRTTRIVAESQDEIYIEHESFKIPPAPVYSLIFD